MHCNSFEDYVLTICALELNITQERCIAALFALSFELFESPLDVAKHFCCAICNTHQTPEEEKVIDRFYAHVNGDIVKTVIYAL